MNEIKKASSKAKVTKFELPTKVHKLTKNIHNWKFNIFELEKLAPKDSLKYVALEIFNFYKFMDIFKIDKNCMSNFLSNIELGCYSDKNIFKEMNPYHNNIHAADVTQTVFYFLFKCGIQQWFSNLEIFSLIIAAIIHDYKHPGTGNEFEENFKTSYFKKFSNRKSLIEKCSLEFFFEFLKDDSVNITKNFEPDDLKAFKELLTLLVLATDLEDHFNQLEDLKKNLIKDTISIPDKIKTMCWILHCADISNPTKDWPIYFEWVRRLMKELYRKGDYEKKHGKKISSNCDRVIDKFKPVQLKFILHFVEPAFDLLNEILEKYHQTKKGSSSTKDEKLTKKGPFLKPWKINIIKNKNEWKKIAN